MQPGSGAGSSASFTVTHRTIPETPVAGKPLGRHVRHDSRSLQYLVAADGTVASATWKRDIPVLDQGQVGSCTGNATVGVLGTDPFYATLPKGTKTDESEALVIYSGAEKIDGGVGYPPEDHGSSGLSVAKEALSLGLIAGYQHITSVSAAQTAIQSGPFIVGTDWYTGMDSPTAAGLVTATGTVRGGHEYECHEYDAEHDLWWFYNSWGTSYGVEGRFCYSSQTFASLLANQGDATVFTPLGVPAPTPTPPPAPAAGITITDPTLVAKIDELAGKQHEDPIAYTTARLKELWESAHRSRSWSRRPIRETTD